MTTTMTPIDQLPILCDELDTIEQQIAALDIRRQTLRADLSEIITQTGPQEIAGFGKLEITAAAKVVTYDRPAIEALILALVAEGNYLLAERLTQTKKESARAGGLRITRPKA